MSTTPSAEMNRKHLTATDPSRVDEAQYTIWVDLVSFLIILVHQPRLRSFASYIDNIFKKSQEILASARPDTRILFSYSRIVLCCQYTCHFLIVQKRTRRKLSAAMPRPPKSLTRLYRVFSKA